MFVNRTVYRFPGGSSCANAVEDAPGRPTATVYNGDVHICRGNQRVLNPAAVAAGDGPVPWEYIYSQGYVMPLNPSITSTNVCKPAQQNEKYMVQIAQQPGGNQVFLQRNLDGADVYVGSGMLKHTGGVNGGTFLISSCENGNTADISKCQPASSTGASRVPMYACVVDEGQVACNNFGGMTQYGFNVQKGTSAALQSSDDARKKCVCPSEDCVTPIPTAATRAATFALPL